MNYSSPSARTNFRQNAGTSYMDLGAVHDPTHDPGSQLRRLLSDKAEGTDSGTDSGPTAAPTLEDVHYQTVLQLPTSGPWLRNLDYLLVVVTRCTTRRNPLFACLRAGQSSALFGSMRGSTRTDTAMDPQYMHAGVHADWGTSLLPRHTYLGRRSTWGDWMGSAILTQTAGPRC